MIDLSKTYTNALNSYRVGHPGGTQGWQSVERWQLCLWNASCSAKYHRQAAVGHWLSLYVKCCRMVDTLIVYQDGDYICPGQYS